MLRWASEDLLHLQREEIGEHYGRYRLHLPEAERAMARSLERYGQLSPVVVCRRQDRYELIDGFKRLGAVRHLVLLHLSEQCNRPRLAIEAARSVVRDAGRRVAVHAAQQ